MARPSGPILSGECRSCPPDVNLPSPKECRPVSNIVLAELEVDGVWESRITWDHPHSASVYKYRVVLEKSVNASWVEKFNGDVASRFFVISNPVSGDYRISITAVNRFDVSSSAVVKSLSMNVPEIMLVGIAATVDNSIYPATALVIGDVEGIDSFPANSIIYETETKSGASQWLPAGKGTAPSSRLTGLDEGQHDIRMRAVPPFGEPSQWHQTQITVFSVEQPSQLTFTPDSTLNHWGQLSWSGAGQSWEVEVRQSTQLLRTQENALWHSTTTDHKIWLNWQPPGDYVITVRSRAGQLASEWSEINVEVADLLPPTDLSFTGDDSGSTGGLVSWQSADERMEMCELELLNDQGEVLHTAVTGSPQAIIPVLAPGEYSALVRCRWREHLSTWASLVITVTDSVSAPSDLKFSTTGETAWQGELIWNPYGLPSELEIINTNTTETVLSLTLLSGYHHLSLLPVGSYQARVRTIGTWSQSPWISTTIVVGQPDTPDNLQYRETPDNVTTAGQLYWEGSTSAGVSGYDVVITDSNSATVLATRVQSTWLDIGNIANGQFTAQVRAVSLLAAEFSDWISTSFTVSPLASPINLSAVEKLVETGTGFTSQITLKWQANDTRTQSYDVEFRLVSVTAWGGLYSGPSNTASRNGLTAGDYRFRVRAINGGMESGWVETSLTVRGIETAPDDITGLQLSGLTGELAQLTWDPITSVDVINGGSVQVKHSPKIGSAVNWATANSIWERLPGNTSMVTVPLLTGTYLVKAVNPADFWSVNAALVESNMASLKGYNRVVERDESDGWPGEKNKAVIDVGGSLTLSETQENSDPPYYIMESPLDLGALFTVRLHLECDGTVYERDTIDDRTDPIDNWEMFDGAQAGGTGLQYQVSTTNDDPADAAATWTDWTQFFVGDFRARAFKLRIVLANPTPSAAGTLNGLRLVADVPDRTETHTGVSAPGNGLPVSYKTPFLAPAMVAITAHGMTTGDYYRITNSTAAGFTIRFYNSSGSGIARDFDFVAVSYGEG
ncbi:hypothetical protein [Endozoicomonas lisbonensis]|uniref:hypothetical protein n=1 Tax=Endozoicomonas lisbonensis TaxID=3120522 RepID=UPI0033934FC7